MSKDFTDDLRKGMERAFKTYKKQYPTSTGEDFHKSAFEEVNKIADIYKRQNDRKKREYPRHKEFDEQ